MVGIWCDIYRHDRCYLVSACGQTPEHHRSRSYWTWRSSVRDCLSFPACDVFLYILVLSFAQLNFSSSSLACSIGNILDSMLLRVSNKEAAESGKEASGSIAPASSSQRLLWCHCYHHCPEDSTNNTCRCAPSHKHWHSHTLLILTNCS